MGGGGQTTSCGGIVVGHAAQRYEAGSEVRQLRLLCSHFDTVRCARLCTSSYGLRSYVLQPLLAYVKPTMLEWTKLKNL